MTVEEALAIVEHIHKLGRLSKVQEAVFRQAWEGRSYQEIADTTSYDPGYIKDTGSKLWQLLSEALGERVTKQNFIAALKRANLSASGRGVTSSPSSSTHHQDWGEAPDVSVFHGRTNELTTLTHWVLQDRCRLITLFGIGGVGKTALSVRLAEQVQDKFEFLIWRSLRNAPRLAEILKENILFRSQQQEANFSSSQDEQLSRLMEYLRQHRCLIILDNIETILRSGERVGRYREGYEGYQQLFERIGDQRHQSCLLLTSRERPGGLAAREEETAPVRSLQLSGVTTEDGKVILRAKGLAQPDASYRQLIDLYRGNPLALKIVATTIEALFNGDVSKFLEQDTIAFGDIRDLLEQQFHRLTPLEQQVMYWLALNREPTTLGELRKDIILDISQRDLIEALESLQRRSLLEKQSSHFTQQPVVMEYITDQVLEQVLQEIKTGKIELIHKFALIKATAKDFVREAQSQLILNSLNRNLLNYFGTKERVRKQLDNLLQEIKHKDGLKLGYAAGNLLNLYRHLNLNVSKYNFSELVIRQAFLQGIELYDVNFSYSEFIDSIFTQTFGGILAVEFSPDGQTLATSSTNCEIQIWSLSNRQRILTLQGHTNWVRGISIHSAANLITSASDDATVRIWELSQGKCKAILSGHSDSVYNAEFSPDGQFIASASNDGSIRLWSVTSETCVRLFEGHLSGVLCASFSPCGKLLASGSFDNTIRIWDVLTGACLYTFTEHSSWVTGLSFSPDNQWLATPSCDCTIRIWRVADWQCIKVLKGHTNWIWRVTWSPDSKLIASASADCTAKIWDITTGKCLNSLGGHTIQVWGVAFSPDGQTIATCAEDQTIAIWDFKAGRRLITMAGHSNWVRPLALSPDTQVFATGHKDKKLRVWARDSYECLQELKSHETGVSSLAFHPDSKLLASGGIDNFIKIWNWQEGNCVAVLRGHDDEIWGLTFSSDGQILASSSFDQTIKLWHLSDNTCFATLTGHCDRVSTLAFHPSGKILVSGSDDGTMKLWHTFSKGCYATLTGHTARVGSVGFTSDGNRLVSSSLDQTLKIWDIQTLSCIRTLQGHQGWVLGVAFLPDNQTIASASSDRTIKIWDGLTGKCLDTLEGHSNWVWTVTPSHNGRRLISTSEDESIRIWDMEAGRCLLALKPQHPYAGMQINGITGISLAQEAMLRELGAI